MYIIKQSEKRGLTMNSSTNAMPKNIKKYALKITTIINIIILMTILFNLFLYYFNNVTPLFIYCCFNLLIWIVSSIFLYTGKPKTYLFITFFGIFMYMILSIVFLGWDYGFQQYCIGFISSFIFTDFYMNRQNHISKKTVIMVCFIVFVYIGLRLWTYKYPHIYEMDNIIISRTLYIINSLIGLSFLITYSFVYFNTVCKLETELTRIANIDPLTGLYNRRKMKDLLKSSRDECEQQQYQIAIAIMDIDKFKLINDTYGHDMGDLVLIKLSEILQAKSTANENFHISRWGGEEFLIFYEKYHQNNNKIFEEFDALRNEISQTTVNENIHFTVTIGLAFYESGKNINSLIKEADENLYTGKNNGRNQVVSSGTHK